MPMCDEPVHHASSLGARVLCRSRPEPIDAWISRSLPQGELRKRAHDASIALTKRTARSLSLTKTQMRDHQRGAAQIAEQGQLFTDRLKTPEACEAFTALDERRPPDFTKVASRS
jgi:hypothetical protein